MSLLSYKYAYYLHFTLVCFFNLMAKLKDSVINGDRQELLLTFYVLFQDGATPLFKASHKGHLDIVIDLLNTGQVSLGVLPNGETAVHAAALFGHKSVLMALITAGADANCLNRVRIHVFTCLSKKSHNKRY